MVVVATLSFIIVPLVNELGVRAGVLVAGAALDDGNGAKNETKRERIRMEWLIFI